MSDLTGLENSVQNALKSIEISKNANSIDQAADIIQKAIDSGQIATHEEAIEVLKQKKRSRLDIRNNSNDYYWMSSFGFIRDLANETGNVPAYNDPNVDLYLDENWRKEPILAGAVYSMSAKMTALSWQVGGTKATALYYAKLLARAMQGTDNNDWGSFISAIAQDFYCTNKGSFMEVARDGSPLYGKMTDLGHIDSLQCELTGNSKTPVQYLSSMTGQRIRLRQGEYIHFASMPSPREEDLGSGFCAVNRAIRSAKLMMAVHDYDMEKLQNLPPEGVAAVTGLTQQEFRDAIALWQSERKKNNSLTFPQVLWLIGSQPNIQVKLDFIGFSQIPESFDRKEVVTQYVNTLALDFTIYNGNKLPWSFTFCLQVLNL